MGTRGFIIYLDEVCIHSLPTNSPVQFYFDIYHQEYYHPRAYPIAMGYVEHLACLYVYDDDVYVTLRFVTNLYIDSTDGIEIFKEFAFENVLNYVYESLRSAGFDINDHPFITKEPMFYDLKSDILVLTEFEGYNAWKPLSVVQVFQGWGHLLGKKAKVKRRN